MVLYSRLLKGNGCRDWLAPRTLKSISPLILSLWDSWMIGNYFSLMTKRKKKSLGLQWEELCSKSKEFWTPILSLLCKLSSFPSLCLLLNEGTGLRDL